MSGRFVGLGVNGLLGWEWTVCKVMSGRLVGLGVDGL